MLLLKTLDITYTVFLLVFLNLNHVIVPSKYFICGKYDILWFHFCSNITTLKYFIICESYFNFFLSQTSNNVKYQCTCRVCGYFHLVVVVCAFHCRNVASFCNLACFRREMTTILNTPICVIVYTKYTDTLYVLINIISHVTVLFYPVCTHIFYQYQFLHKLSCVNNKK